MSVYSEKILSGQEPLPEGGFLFRELQSFNPVRDPEGQLNIIKNIINQQSLRAPFTIFKNEELTIELQEYFNIRGNNHQIQWICFSTQPFAGYPNWLNHLVLKFVVHIEREHNSMK